MISRQVYHELARGLAQCGRNLLQLSEHLLDADRREQEMAGGLTRDEELQICSSRACRRCGGTRRGYRDVEWERMREICHTCSEAMKRTAPERT